MKLTIILVVLFTLLRLGRFAQPHAICFQPCLKPLRLCTSRSSPPFPSPCSQRSLSNTPALPFLPPLLPLHLRVSIVLIPAHGLSLPSYHIHQTLIVSHASTHATTRHPPTTSPSQSHPYNQLTEAHPSPDLYSTVTAPDVLLPSSSTVGPTDTWSTPGICFTPCAHTWIQPRSSPWVMAPRNVPSKGSEASSW